MKEYVVTLETLAGGKAAEVFEVELRSLLANIADPNTSATATRRLRLELTIKPSADRKSAKVVVTSKANVAPVNAIETAFWLSRHAGQPVAVEFDPEQLRLDPDNVIDLRAASSGAAVPKGE